MKFKFNLDNKNINKPRGKIWWAYQFNIPPRGENTVEFKKNNSSNINVGIAYYGRFCLFCI